MSTLLILALLLVAAGLAASALTRQPRLNAARKRAEVQRDRMARVLREIYTQATKAQEVEDNALAAYVCTAIESSLTEEERLKLNA